MNEIEKTKEDFKWLLSLLPKAPDLKLLETATQAVALISAVNVGRDTPTQEDSIKVALSAFLAARARVVDEERFVTIHPTTYFQVAQFLLVQNYDFEEDTEEKFGAFIQRLRFDPKL
jgi:hypothetical protein